MLWKLWALLLISYLASFLFLLSAVIQRELTWCWFPLTLGSAAGFQAALSIGCKQFVEARKVRRESLVSSGVIAGVLAGIVLYYSPYLGYFIFYFLCLCWAEFLIAIVYFAIKLIRLQKY